ncbi:MAG: helix-turn-helix transcriptional regulator [Verrucomicrobiae bacterium]
MKRKTAFPWWKGRGPEYIAREVCEVRYARPSVAFHRFDKLKKHSMKMTFGQFIRSLRITRGMTQRALSQAVGFRSLAHLSDIESGKRNPATATFAKFAKALGVTVADLESRDIRGVVEAAKALFDRKPEMVGAFLKVIEAAKKMDAEELVARVAGKGPRRDGETSPTGQRAARENVPVSPFRTEKLVEKQKRTPDQPTLF